jgi:hypothetical protein
LSFLKFCLIGAQEKMIFLYSIGLKHEGKLKGFGALVAMAFMHFESK